jgi:hypothetical protein
MSAINEKTTESNFSEKHSFLMYTRNIDINITANRENLLLTSTN